MRHNLAVPSIFEDSLFDDWMDFPFDRDWEKEFFGKRNPLYGKNADRLMRTDVREVGGNYEVDIDLPGFKKEEVQIKLENGVLTISAAKGLDKDEQDKKGNYIRRERYSGRLSRSYFVGEGVRKEDIHARFEDGILKLQLPKEEPKRVEENHYITIEG